jgi:2-polyprenyl-3-methyl-5-hydroxy-6-metoxy-1,4-benzoquinol methylase
MPTAAPSDFACPICASSNGRWVAEAHGLRVARCVECGHGYVWPVPTPDFLDAIYRDAAYYKGGYDSIGFTDYRSLEPARRRMFTRHLSRIESVTQVGRILDIGCATGDFLAVARERGWAVFGADPSAARADVEEKGIQLVGTTVQDADIAPGSLDAITFWDVLEHVTDPVADLSRAGKLLKPGGVIALTVPDSANFLARTSGRRWFGYKTAGEHLQFFTGESLSRAFAKTRMTLRTRQATTWSCTLGFLGGRAGIYLGPPGRMVRAILTRSRLASVVVDMPQINQFALGINAPVVSRVAQGVAS